MVFFAGCKISKLARCQNFGRHHHQFSRHAFKLINRFAELATLGRIGKGQFQRTLRHANGARGRLNARALKGFHQLLKALARLAAEDGVFWHGKTVEGNVIFFHAAIAQHFNLAALHAVGGERGFVIAARFFGQEHGQASMAFHIGFAAHQKRHNIGARAMGNPCFGADNFIARLGLFGARRQAGQVGARIGFGKHGGGQHRAIGNARQIVLLLRLCAILQNQLGRNIRARAERADTNIAAR